MPVIVTIKDGRPADVIRRAHWPDYYAAIKAGDAIAYVAAGDPALAEPVKGDPDHPRKATSETPLTTRPMRELTALNDVPLRHWKIAAGPSLVEMTVTEKQAVDAARATVEAAAIAHRLVSEKIMVGSEVAGIKQAIIDKKLPADHPLPSYPQ